MLRHPNTKKPGLVVTGGRDRFVLRGPRPFTSTSISLGGLRSRIGRVQTMLRVSEFRSPSHRFSQHDQDSSELAQTQKDFEIPLPTIVLNRLDGLPAQQAHGAF